MYSKLSPLYVHNFLYLQVENENSLVHFQDVFKNYFASMVILILHSNLESLRLATGKSKGKRRKKGYVFTGLSFITEEVHPGRISSSGVDHTKEFPKIS